MATHDYDIANQSGANFRTDLNNVLDAIVSNNSNGSDPSTTFAYMWWVDTGNNVLKLRNSANNAWITLPMSITASNTITPTLNLGTGVAEDVKIVYDGNAKDFYIALDDSSDSLIVGEGSTVGTNAILTITDDSVTIGDGAAVDTKIVFDGNAQDFYIGLDDSADDLVIGVGSTVGTTGAISIDENAVASVNGITSKSFATDSFMIGDTTTGTLSSASNNTGVGVDVFEALTVADNCTAIGKSALAANRTGSKQTAVGQGALATCTTGAGNTAIGADAATAITTGNDNTIVGHDAGDSLTTGSNNVVMGYQALATCTEGNNNIALGRNSLKDVTSGSSNVAVGDDAGENVTTGVHNVVIGIDCGDTLTTGGDNILIGNTARPSGSGGANQIAMGTVATCVGDNNFTFGNQSTDSNIAFGATSITAPSDIRLKEEIEDEKIGLDFIKDLRPVTFRWKKAKDVPPELKVHSDSENRVMNGKYNHGFIAQEVKEVIDKHNFKEGFDMWQEDEADGRQRVAPSALMSVIVKAVQELSTQVEELKTEIKILKEQ